MLRTALIPLFLLLALPLRLPAQPSPEAADETEVIVVTGRVPGPPLWQVTNGENVLWIFPAFSPVPKGMEWDSARVERVLADAGVYLIEPGWGISMSSTSASLREMRDEQELVDRLSHLPADKTLQDVLGPELYARYAAVKEEYFRRNDDIDTLRPLFAMQSMRDEVHQEAGLASASAIFNEIERLARRNRQLQRIDTRVFLDLKLEPSEVNERWQSLMSSLAPDTERDCFELEVRRVEVDLDAIRRRANEWANGRINEFRAVQLRTGDNPCQAMFYTSSEGEVMQDLTRQSEEKWLAGAEEALTNHRTGFAVLDIIELLKEDGLVSRLAEKGYSVRAPD
jgi:hypothetical protein